MAANTEDFVSTLNMALGHEFAAPLVLKCELCGMSLYVDTAEVKQAMKSSDKFFKFVSKLNRCSGVVQ